MKNSKLIYKIKKNYKYYFSPQHSCKLIVQKRKSYFFSYSFQSGCVHELFLISIVKPCTYNTLVYDKLITTLFQAIIKVRCKLSQRNNILDISLDFLSILNSKQYSKTLRQINRKLKAYELFPGF